MASLAPLEASENFHGCHRQWQHRFHLARLDIFGVVHFPVSEIALQM
jgi:hypothetical protein